VIGGGTEVVVVGGSVVVVVVVGGEVELAVVGELDVEVVVASLCTCAEAFVEGVEEQALALIASPRSTSAMPALRLAAAILTRASIISTRPATFGRCLRRPVLHRTSAVAVDP
jgi:hypothetical protein